MHTYAIEFLSCGRWVFDHRQRADSEHAALRQAASRLGGFGILPVRARAIVQ